MTDDNDWRTGAGSDIARLEQAVLDAADAYFTPSRLIIALHAGMQPGIEELALAVQAWRAKR